jgi:hypothetical protein
MYDGQMNAKEISDTCALVEFRRSFFISNVNPKTPYEHVSEGK